MPGSSTASGRDEVHTQSGPSSNADPSSSPAAAVAAVAQASTSHSSSSSSHTGLQQRQPPPRPAASASPPLPSSASTASSVRVTGGQQQQRQRTNPKEEKGSEANRIKGDTVGHVGIANRDPAALHGVRDTVEYRAAWDVELWKAIQADRFRQQLDCAKRRAYADLDRGVRASEKAARERHDERVAALDIREAAVNEEERKLRERQQRVQEMEKNLRGMRQQLLDAQKRVEEEVRAQVRRANDDIAHKAKMLQERVQAAEQQARRAEERQRQSHEEYLALYEAFHRFRAQHLTAPVRHVEEEGGGTGNGLSGLCSPIPSTTTATTAGGVAVAQIEIERLRAQLQLQSQQHQLAMEQVEQRYAGQVADLTQRCRHLEEHNRRLTAAVARRREALRQHRSAAAQHTSQAAPSPHSDPNTEGTHDQNESLKASCASPGTASAALVGLAQEVQRLRREQKELVEGSGGALSEGDVVVRRLGERIIELEALWKESVVRGIEVSA